MHHAIRKARTSDIPALARIRAAVRENVLSDPSKVPTTAYQTFIDRSAIWVWEEDGRVLGFCAADPGDGTIWALFVDPAEEGRGIGRHLLPCALEDLKRAGWTEAHLMTDVGSRAERFYATGGWTAVGLSQPGVCLFRKALR